MDDVAADITQQKYSNNKCYDSAFKYIQIYRYKYGGDEKQMHETSPKENVQRERNKIIRIISLIDV